MRLQIASFVKGGRRRTVLDFALEGRGWRIVLSALLVWRLRLGRGFRVELRSLFVVRV